MSRYWSTSVRSDSQSATSFSGSWKRNKKKKKSVINEFTILKIYKCSLNVNDKLLLEDSLLFIWVDSASNGINKCKMSINKPSRCGGTTEHHPGWRSASLTTAALESGAHRSRDLGPLPSVSNNQKEKLKTSALKKMNAVYRLQRKNQTENCWWPVATVLWKTTFDLLMEQ